MHTKNWRNQKSSATNNDSNDAPFDSPFDGVNHEVQGTFLSDNFKDNDSSNKESRNMRKTEGLRTKKSTGEAQHTEFRKVGCPSYASKKILSKSSESRGVPEDSGEQQAARFNSDIPDGFQGADNGAKRVKTRGTYSHAQTEHETLGQRSQNRGGDGHIREQTSSNPIHSDTEESKWNVPGTENGDGIEENNNKYQFRNKVGVLDLTRNSTEVRKWHDSSSRTENRQKHVEDARNEVPKANVNLKDLKNKTAEELLNLAESLKIENPSYLHKHDLVFAISKVFAEQGTMIVGDGMLEILQDGYGFLRSSEANYIPGPDDIYVSPVYVKKFALRTGDTIIGPIRAPKKGERYFALTNIHTLTGLEISKNKHRVHFDDLTPIYPMTQIKLETVEPQKDFSGRIIDMVAPLGRGQRALIVAPPRTGKTILMQNISHSITSNYPEIQLIVLLIGERPEEVTDMSRSVRGEVVSSTFDEPSYRHVQLAEMVIEKAKRMVERGQDVVILLDSITRLARAYNDVVPSSGKVLSGGVDSNALQRPKRLLGAARNTEEGGSLTIIATALVETGSKMDEVIFEEFKGTGNLEIILDRKISDKRIFPAIDIVKSGTRKEDLLIDKATLAKIWVLRRVMNPMGANEAIDFLNDKLRYHKNNHEFFEQMNTYK